MRERSIPALRLSQSLGWPAEDLAFLESIGGRLRGLEVYHWDVRDLTPISSCRNLEFLGLQCESRRAPDLARLPLRVLFANWTRALRSVFDCTGLQHLNLTQFPEDDLRRLSKMPGLSQLKLTSRKLARLDGIDALARLETLDLFDCRALSDLGGLERLAGLRHLELEACRRFAKLPPFGAHAKLEKVRLIDCGKLRSLRPLAGCLMLRELLFSGDTEIEDGDLAFLTRLPRLEKVSFANRPGYTHTREQLQESPSAPKLPFPPGRDRSPRHERRCCEGGPFASAKREQSRNMLR